jgi:PAS domain S-box-containing protein
MPASDSPPELLLVDDEMDIRLILRRLLERDGYRVTEARNGEEAVELCRQQLPDMILMDILMPVMDGAEACAQIQLLPGGDRVPVLMITALSDKQTIDRCFDAGATDYLTKPINQQVLRRRVARVLRTRQAETALRANEARLASIINTSTDAIILTTHERQITLVNPAAEHMFGGSSAELLNIALAELLPQCSNLPEGRNPTRAGEYVQCEGHRRDGTVFPCEVSLGQFEQHDRLMRTVTVRDITRRKQAEAEIERRVQQLASLAQMGQAVTTQLDLDEVLRTVIDQVMLRLSAEGVSILLVDSPTELIFAAVNGASADRLRGVRIPATAGIAGEVLRSGQAARARTVEDRSRIYRKIEEVSQYHTRDIVAVPLKLGSEALGVMEAVHSQPYAFNDDDLRLLESAGSWAAIAIGNARQHQRLQRRLRESEVMADLGRALNETLNLDQVLQQIVVAARQIIPTASMASLALIDEARQRVYTVTERGRVEHDLRDAQADWQRRLMGDLPDQAVVTQLPDGQLSGLALPDGILPQTRALLTAPVHSGTERFGSIIVQSNEAHAFDADDERLLLLLSVEAAIAIKNARLYQSEHTQRELAEALRDTAATIIGALDLEDVLDRILDNVGRVAPHDAANIMLVDSGVARIARWRGYNRSAQEQLQARRFSVADTWQLRQMAETHQGLDVANTGEFLAWVTLPGSRPVQSFCGAPIRFKRKLLGFINLESTTPGFFKPEMAERLQTFANQAAPAIDNARLYQLEQEEQQRLQQTHAVAVQSEKMEALGRLASAMSRAMQQSLTVMRHEIEQGLHADPEWAALRTLGREVERLEQITRNVVSFTQPEAEPKRAVQLTELIQQALAQARPLTEQYHIQATSDFADLPPVLAAPQQLTQVFYYLIENAVEAAGQRGQVHVATQRDQQSVSVTFIDDGPAISPDDMPHIFEPFYTTKLHGTGLGLAISHKVVQQQGGALTAENVTKDRGVMFIVKLPLLTAA